MQAQEFPRYCAPLWIVCVGIARLARGRSLAQVGEGARRAREATRTGDRSLASWANACRSRGHEAQPPGSDTGRTGRLPRLPSTSTEILANLNLSVAAGPVSRP
jgi:hypothetical protein